MKIACVTTNYVARESGYSMRPFLWGKAERITHEAFSGPLFESKFKDLMTLIHSLDFTAIELWYAHLPFQLSNDRLTVAQSILKEMGIRVASYYFSVGHNTPTQSIEDACKVARSLSAPFLVGGVDLTRRDDVANVCKAYGLRYALENHSEKTPLELLNKIDGYTDCFGVASDTGWWGTQGYDAVQATRELWPHLLHVHLKDVRGMNEHVTCGFGEGIVNVQGVVKELIDSAYSGYACIEHEPEYDDPTPKLQTSYTMLNEWLRDGFPSGQTTSSV